MSSAAPSDWRPDWSDGQILGSPAIIKAALKAGQYRDLIAAAKTRSQGSTWLSRQFNITQRSAHSLLDTYEKEINLQAGDAPRVLRRVKTEWDQYMTRVRRQRDESQRKKLLDSAMKGPNDFYMFLITEHIQKAWKKHSANKEASSASAWNKIGYDNQFLWPLKEFKATFLGG